jgi:hypothetical protein
MLNDTVAVALVDHSGTLYLTGVTSLSDAAAASLAARRDEVELDGLTSLSPRAQTLLSQHPQVRLPTRFR